MVAFRSLQGRLTAIYAGLFALAMLALAGALSLAIERIASVEAGRQLDSSGAVYQRLWQQRSAQLQDAANLLSRDFGFRAAVATGDRSTAVSALENLRTRLGVSQAFIVSSADARILGADAQYSDAEAQAMWRSFDAGRLVGIARIGDAPREIVAAPILSPELIGWIVFAVDLDQAQMRGLQALSPVKLKAGIIVRRSGGGWEKIAGDFAPVRSADGELISRHLGASTSLVDIGGQRSFTAIKLLPTLAGSEPAALMLVYPKAEAMAAYRPIQAAVPVFALLGLLAMAYASWRTAAKITRPLSQLDAAVGRLAAGHNTKVDIVASDEIGRLANHFNDMARQIEERERRITQLAFNDVLTELPNRFMFHQQVDLLLGSTDRDKARFALLYLDLDHFKSINDTLGHGVGDALLVKVTQVLRQIARGHFVGRLGGDEFVVIMAQADAMQAERLAAEIISALQQPLSVGGHDVRTGTSVGIALSAGDEDAVTLLRNADLALYRAKEAGRGTSCFFEQSLNQRAQQRREIETDLRRAIERGEFELYFQPLFDLTRNRIGAFEALLRWHHPERGLVSPAEFIGVAEETGMIVQIGTWVMREACRRAKQWPDHIRIAVNVSTVQFQRGGLDSVVLQALSASGLEPQRLEIEITESIFLESSEPTLALLHRLRAMGVRIALDDFGTGYSSLSYLQSFPFDKLKIDRSFIQNLMIKPGAAAVIRAITDLAAALGMETTAEGVEESAQLAELRSQGCTSIQGFLFSRPLTAADAQGLIGNASWISVQSAA